MLFVLKVDFETSYRQRATISEEQIALSSGLLTTSHREINKYLWLFQTACPSDMCEWKQQQQQQLPAAKPDGAALWLGAKDAEQSLTEFWHDAENEYPEFGGNMHPVNFCLFGSIKCVKWPSRFWLAPKNQAQEQDWMWTHVWTFVQTQKWSYSDFTSSPTSNSCTMYYLWGISSLLSALSSLHLYTALWTLSSPDCPLLCISFFCQPQIDRAGHSDLNYDFKVTFSHCAHTYCTFLSHLAPYWWLNTWDTSSVGKYRCTQQVSIVFHLKFPLVPVCFSLERLTEV